MLVILMSPTAHTGEAINNVTGYVDSTIESWAKQNISNLRLLEVETRIRNYSKTDYRILGMTELAGNSNEKYLSQFSFSSFDSTETLNLGIVWRKLNANQTLMYGYNAFYDHEINSNHSRIGFGVELKSSVYDVNFNMYRALSSKKVVRSITEEAADGYDLEVGIYIPYMPWAKVYYKGYQWDSSIFDIKHGEVLSLHLQPTGRLTIEAGIQDDNTMSNDRTFLKLTYVVCCNNNTTNRNFVFMTPSAYSYKSVADRFYEKVRRENNIVKGINGAAVIGRGT
jgi:adhesin/invasin